MAPERGLDLEMAFSRNLQGCHEQLSCPFWLAGGGSLATDEAHLY
jgi:hypothetical protein